MDTEVYAAITAMIISTVVAGGLSVWRRWVEEEELSRVRNRDQFRGLLDSLERIRKADCPPADPDADLPLAEEIPNDAPYQGRWPCPTCKAVFPCHSSMLGYMRKTGYCSVWCFLNAANPIPVDPKVHAEPRKEMT